MKLPQARLDVLRTDLEDEVVLYDPERHLAHSLNRAAGAIWNHCDGQNNLAGLQRLVSDELGVPVEESAIRLGLQDLARTHLLAQNFEDDEAKRLNRRTALKTAGRRLAVVALASPLVISALVPKPAAAISFRSP